MNQNELYNYMTNRVCELFDITENQLKSKSRLHEVVNARHTWHLLIRIHLDWSYKKIGSLTDRDHSTIMNSMDKVDESIRLNGRGALSKSELQNLNIIHDETNRRITRKMTTNSMSLMG